MSSTQRRVLHVDPHEGAAAAGIAHEALEQRAAEVEVDLQPEPGQLDGDVRVEPVGGDRGQHVTVGGGDRLRLRGAVDLLAEHVDRRPLLPSAFRATTVRRASSSVGPAMYGAETRRTTERGTVGKHG